MIPIILKMTISNDPIKRVIFFQSSTSLHFIFLSLFDTDTSSSFTNFFEVLFLFESIRQKLKTLFDFQNSSYFQK